MKHITVIKLNLKFYTILGVIAVCGWALWWFLNHSFMMLVVNPADAVVTLDNAPVKVSRTGRIERTIKPGQHVLKVEANGYTSFTEVVTFKRTQRKKVTVSLKESPKPFKVADGNFLKKDKDFNGFFYLGDGGRTLYKTKLGINDEGEIETKSNSAITDRRLSGIEEIIWSPNFDLALFRKKDGIYLFDFWKYDFIHQTETKWGDDVGAIAWSPDNSKIAYFYHKDGQKSLMFSNIARTEETRVANLAEHNIDNPILRWSPDSEWLIVIPRNGINYATNKIFLFNAYSREFKEFTETGSQIDALFSPDNNKVIYATYSGDPNSPIKSLVSIANRDGSDKQSLNLRAEIRKIGWKNDSKGLIVASYDPVKQREFIYGFDIMAKERTGFSIAPIDTDQVSSITVSDDSKMAFYETASGIFALKLE